MSLIVRVGIDFLKVLLMYSLGFERMLTESQSTSWFSVHACLANADELNQRGTVLSCVQPYVGTAS